MLVQRNVAPLLLVPVSLERRQGRDFFVMRGRDDDMIVNVSLGEKLRAAFGITLPDLPEGDDWLPNEYFDAVATAIAGEKRWEVDRTGIGLGFFTFSRFLMWRDLDTAAWPDGGKLLGNGLLGKLLGEGLLASLSRRLLPMMNQSTATSISRQPSTCLTLIAPKLFVSKKFAVVAIWLSKARPERVNHRRLQTSLLQRSMKGNLCFL
jgi:hypothetical protein